MVLNLNLAHFSFSFFLSLSTLYYSALPLSIDPSHSLKIEKMQEPSLGMMGGLSGEVSGDHHRQLKAEIATHPLYEQLLAAHVSCLRVATPIDQLPLIDAQLSHSHHLIRSYVSHHTHSLSPNDRQELDNFLVNIPNKQYYYCFFFLTKQIN